MDVIEGGLCFAAMLRADWLEGLHHHFYPRAS
jgi:hypothetical protein